MITRAVRGHRMVAHRRLRSGVGLLLLLCSVVPWWRAAGTAGAVPSAQRHLPMQATATHTPVAADLVLTWRHDHWWDYCISGHQPWVTSLWVTNAGGTDAGPFVVHDQQVQWRLTRLAAGSSFYLEEWGPYPSFPLVIDPYGQVPEANEYNNVIEPPEDSPWTATPIAGKDGGTPRPPGRSGTRAMPPAMSTLPVFCTARPPAATLTPVGDPPLPDLVVAKAVWNRLVIDAPDGTGPCWPENQPWRFALTIRNQGNDNAGWFTVSGGEAVWRVAGLQAGAERTFASEPRFLPGQVSVDSDAEVQESREDNNNLVTAPNGTPTPPGRAPRTCPAVPTLPSPTPSLTPTITTTWTPRPTRTATFTRTATATRTRVVTRTATATRTGTPRTPGASSTVPPLLLPALRSGM